MFKVNGNTRATCEICLKLTKAPERRHLCRSGVFIVNFKQISHIVILFPLLALNKQKLARKIGIKIYKKHAESEQKGYE